MWTTIGPTLTYISKKLKEFLFFIEFVHFEGKSVCGI